MKRKLRLTVFCLFFACAPLTAPAAYALDPDWALMDENPDSGFFFDRNGTTKVREGVVQVRTRVVYTEKGKKEALKMLGGMPEPQKLYESRYMYQIDCTEKQARLMSATHFDKSGAILKSSDLSSFSQWEYLPPGSRMIMIANQACAP